MTTRLFPQTVETHSNTERWLLTYADMITLLAAFFLMLYSMSVMSKGKFAQIASSVRSGFHSAESGSAGVMSGSRTRGIAGGNGQAAKVSAAMLNLRAYVEKHHMSGKITTRTDERGTVVSLLADDLLFGRGRADLQSGSDDALKQIARLIDAAPNQVQIEGHTDDLPIRTNSFPSNWELSSVRAGTVLRWFTERAGLARQRFTASGYADTRPLAPNTNDANRARNRRVDIVLLKTDAERGRELRRQTEIQRVLADKEPSIEPAQGGATGSEKATSESLGAFAARTNAPEAAQTGPGRAQTGSTGRTEGTTIEP